MHLIGDMNHIGYAENCLVEGDMNHIRKHKNCEFKGDMNHH